MGESADCLSHLLSLNTPSLKINTFLRRTAGPAPGVAAGVCLGGGLGGGIAQWRLRATLGAALLWLRSRALNASSGGGLRHI